VKDPALRQAAEEQAREAVTDDLTDEVPRFHGPKLRHPTRRARGSPRPQAKGSRQPRSNPHRQAARREDRFATPEEQEQIARYVGWGGLKNVFPDPISGAYGKGFEDVGAELAELLTPEEYETARRSIQYAHFTAEKVVREMWRAAAAPRLRRRPDLRAGHGHRQLPRHDARQPARRCVHYQGVEMDGITAAIAKALYPKHGVTRPTLPPMRRARTPSAWSSATRPSRRPSSRRTRPTATLGMVLHDYFFAKTSMRCSRAERWLFVTSAGTMNKMDRRPASIWPSGHGSPARSACRADRLCRERRDRGYDRHRLPGQEGAGRRAAGMGRTGFVD
jgi:hypothetical protein